MYGATFEFNAARAARYPVVMRRSQIRKPILRAHSGSRRQVIRAFGGYS